MPAPEHADAPLIAVVGATATGKSDLALDIAEELGGEIINADALQLYRGMDIGTAKLPVAERRGIRHHLLDILEVREEASVSSYQQLAREAVAQIWERGRVPVVVGGSGLYLRALLDDIAFPPTDSAVRARWEERVRRLGAGAAWEELAARDPEAARMIGMTDERRIVRALEVNEITGASFRAFLPRRAYLDEATVQIGLRRERPELHERIERRVSRMVRDGLLEETRALRAQGLEQGRTARRAIGYEQALAVLDGRMGCGEAMEATVAGTRRLVRKQDTWFRRDERVHWLETSAEDDPRDLRERALAIIDRAARTTLQA